MKTLEVKELAERIDELLRLVEEKGETFDITNHGKVIARLVPASEPESSVKPSLTPFWEKMERLATKIDAYLPDKVDAVEIVRDVRRDL